MDEGSLLGDSQEEDDDISDGEAEELLREDTVSLHSPDSSLMDEEESAPRSWRSELNPNAKITRSTASSSRPHCLPGREKGRFKFLSSRSLEEHHSRGLELRRTFW
jgi:hypothetical protein